MDIVAKKDSWRCESRPVKATFQYLCSQHNACTLNDEQALIEGECESMFRVHVMRCRWTFSSWSKETKSSHCCSFSLLPPNPVIYYGLYDIEGATNKDNLLIDAYASFNTHVGYTHRMPLLELKSLSVCAMNNNKNKYNGGSSSTSSTTSSSSSTTSSSSGSGNWYNFNNYYRSSSCPKDGTYPFETMFTLEAPKSRLLSWLATGYHGEATVDFYLERTMDLVGRCHIPMKTKPTLPIPSGMVVTTLLMVIGCASLGYFIFWKRRQVKIPKGKPDDKKEVLLMHEHAFGKTIDTARSKGRNEPVVDLVAW